jgi:hypothetical protein
VADSSRQSRDERAELTPIKEYHIPLLLLMLSENCQVLFFFFQTHVSRSRIPICLSIAFEILVNTVEN